MNITGNTDYDNLTLNEKENTGTVFCCVCF